MLRHHAARRATIIAASAALVVSLGQALPAAADHAPLDPTNPATPVTVTADALATPQIDGVAWSQVVVGRTVYVAGSFAAVRPFGAAAGVNTTPRANLLAYNIDTGALLNWAPSLDAQARAITASPDGKRIYVAGDFSKVDGQWRLHVAAFDTATGALVSGFAPTLSSNALAVAATNTTVYVGGEFNSAASVTGGALVPRAKVAAFAATDGTLLDFNPNANDSVASMTVLKDGSKVVLGGRFTTLGGAAAYGLGWVDPTTGVSTPMPANAQIRNAGAEASIVSLAADETAIYGTGYVFGRGGNIEGPFRISATTGELIWVADCHGDTYSIFPGDQAVYTASHQHYCGNIGAFPQTDPWTYYHSTAFSMAATGVNTPDIYGYADHPGQPSPTLLNWFPQWYTGTYTGQGQAGWSITGNADYIVVGGEFIGLNGAAQQGLTRFARAAQAPKKQGPRLSGAAFNPSVNSFTSGEVRVHFSTNWDRDNQTLTYKLYRGAENTTPVFTETITTPFWKVLGRSVVDKNLTPGSTQQYRLTATDPDGNIARSDWVPVTVAAGGELSPYAAGVLADAADDYWRLGEPAGDFVDWAGGLDLAVGAGVTRNEAGAVADDANAAAAFAGSSTGLAATKSATPGPATFSVEAWFKTTSTRGGKIVGFGSAASGDSSNYDRHLYLNNNGQVYFGVYTSSAATVNSTATYRDGQWHHAVGTLDGTGMKLFVDGVRVAARADATTPQAYDGFWRIGGDNLSSWSSRPTSKYFAGTIDDVAVYPTALTTAQIRAHYAASGRTATVPARPTDAYGQAVYDAAPEAYWRFNETSGSAVSDSGINNYPGTVTGNYVRNQTGALSGTTNKALLLQRTGNSNGGWVYSTQQSPAPAAVSQEAWFRTSSTQGGTIMGFADRSTQASTTGGRDRQVYLRNDGTMVFAVQGTTITTTAKYNDNKWHQAVATQGTDGMKLYVDGALAGTNARTQAATLTGYWKVGGDPNGVSTSANLVGYFDDAAMYTRVLTAADVAAHYALGTGAPVPNQVPAAAFSATSTKLTASFDAGGSADADGTITGYAWDFGDGGTGTGATATHTYAAAGTYPVTLTVTDDKSGQGVVRHDVVVVANGAPVAAFSATPGRLQVSVDATASSDADGTVTGFDWDFGDGATGTGATASHDYAAAGTFAVKLTVTDSDGAVASVTHDVVVPGNTAPVAAFTATPGKLKVSVDGSASADPDGTIASYGWDFGDGGTGTGATASHTYAAVGTYAVTLTVTDNDGTGATLTKQVAVTANQPPTAAFATTQSNLSVHGDASESADADGTIATYLWNFGDGASLAGKTVDHTYTQAGTYTVTLTVTDDDGASTTAAKQVTVAPTVIEYARDSFGRTTTTGWGTADAGGAWTLNSSAALFKVGGGLGAMALTAPAAGPQARLNLVRAGDVDVRVSWSLDKLSSPGSVVGYVNTRSQAWGTEYRTKVFVSATGVVTLELDSVNANAETFLTSTVIPGLTYRAGDTLNLRTQAVGSGVTTLRAKVWAAGSTEPANWQVTRTDSTTTLQPAGAIGLGTYLSSQSTNPPVSSRFSALVATAP